jgi:oligoribonuclease NrnB/cAMP/cGMP phosphodiesterase (DHH superfamily)
MCYNQIMNYVLYHGNCMDGFGAAFAAWLHFKEKNLPYELLACNYNEPFPLTDEQVRGSNIFVVDFSFPRAVLERVCLTAAKVQVLDHHPTAEADLASLPCAHFDMSQSGAMLAWKYFHPEKKIPVLMNYIQDRDLWVWKLPHSKEINMVIQGQPLNASQMDSFKSFMDSMESQETVNLLKSQGEAILNFQNQFVDLAIKRSLVLVEIGGHLVPGCNTSIFESETCQRILDKFPEYPFSVTFYSNSNSDDTNVSLRSKGFDVSAVASMYNGGGHKQASGCRIKSKDFVIKKKV